MTKEIHDYDFVPIRAVEELEDRLSEPSAKLVEFMGRLDGDLAVLGAGGKMGPSLVKLVSRAFENSKSRRKKRIIAVSRFSSLDIRKDLESYSLEVIPIDLLDESQLQNLPDARNIIFMAGQKFGTTGNEYNTWATNVYLAGRVAEKFKNSKIVAFSTGNVYPLVPQVSGGATEETLPSPIGEYAQSRLAAERILEFFSRRNNTPISIIRLNYAVELRYGVLHDIGKAVMEHKPIDLKMGWVNVIWQRDANEIAIRSLDFASSPPAVFNVTGSDCISVREIAEKFGKIFGTKPEFSGSEGSNALLSNSSKSDRIFGGSNVTLDQMIEWVAEWLATGGPSLDKPTHFQETEGKF